MFKNEISLKDKSLFDSYTTDYPYEISCMNFTCLYMWRKYNKLTYEVINDYLCVAGIAQNKPFVLPPLTRKEYNISSLSDTLETIKIKFKQLNDPFRVKLLPKHMNDLFDKVMPSQFRFQADRDNFDYVYLAEDLIELKGRKLHSKKNHWNYFMNNIDHQYVPLTKDLFHDCMALVRELKQGYATSQPEVLDSEEEAIFEALHNMEALNFKGGAILINNKVEAFTFGEQLNSNTMLIHIEKANANFRGLYQAINQQFCELHCTHVKYVNREEDMGLEYLRKAKKSYQPVKMIEKYDATLIKEDDYANKVASGA